MSEGNDAALWKNIMRDQIWVKMNHFFSRKLRLLASKSSPKIGWLRSHRRQGREEGEQDAERAGWGCILKQANLQGLCTSFWATFSTAPCFNFASWMKLKLTAECEWSTQWWVIKVRQESQQFNSSVADVPRRGREQCCKESLPKGCKAVGTRAWGPGESILEPQCLLLKKSGIICLLVTVSPCIAQTGPKLVRFLTPFHRTRSVNLFLMLHVLKPFHMETCVTDFLHVNMLWKAKATLTVQSVLFSALCKSPAAPLTQDLQLDLAKIWASLGPVELTESPLITFVSLPQIATMWVQFHMRILGPMSQNKLSLSLFQWRLEDLDQP